MSKSWRLLSAGRPGEKSSLAPAGTAPASTAAATTTGHHKLPSLQFSSPIGGENGSNLTANVWQHLDAGRFESYLEFSRNGPANQDLHAYFNEVAHDPVRLLLKEHGFLAFQLSFACQTKQRQPRRHVENRRHATLTVGNRNQHARRNASFMPAPTRLAAESKSSLKSGVAAVAAPALGAVLRGKVQQAQGAAYRTLRRRRAAGQGSGFSTAIRSLACWIRSTRLCTLGGGGAAPARSTPAITSSGRFACKKDRTSNRSHQQSRIRRQGLRPASCRQ